MNELDLKMIYSPYSTISRVCLCFCFDSCNMSQNVTFCYYQHEVNSKFRVTDTKLYVLFFQNHFMKQFPSCENQRKSWVKNSNCLKDKVWIASIHFPNLVPRVSHLTAPWSELGETLGDDNEWVASNPIPVFAQRTLGSSGGKHMYSEKLFCFRERSTLFRRPFIANEFRQCWYVENVSFCLNNRELCIRRTDKFPCLRKVYFEIYIA